MWDDSQSDAARIYRTLEASAAEQGSEKLRRKFHSTSSEEVRLAVALRGFFLTDGGEEYASWLEEHADSAGEVLVELGDREKLAEFERRGWLDEELTEQLLRLAIEQRRSGMTVWLLRLKEQKYGFPDRDFQLW
ncbi:MAG: hypothetical protein LUE31_11220 [Lachnospiraceae bacterium]|nr:hypothetical protein [Lachnospiraceae bacterium]